MFHNQGEVDAFLAGAAEWGRRSPAIHRGPTLMADEIPEFYCRAWSGVSKRWVAYVDCDKDYPDKLQLLGPVSINGKVYRCTGVLISVMNHRTGQQLFKGERIGLEVEAP